MKKTNKLVTVSNIVSFVLIVALAVLQFLPYWAEIPGEEGAVSIAKGVWFADAKSQMPVLMLHVWTLVIGAVCVYFCLIRSKGTISFIPVGVLAVVNTLGYLKPEAMGASLWIVHLILSCLLFVPAIILFVFWLRGAIRWFTVKES